MFLFSTRSLQAQEKGLTGTASSLPPGYGSLSSDLERMRFLTRAIADSLNQGSLSHIYDWAGIGLQIAERNPIDSMKAIFNFFLGKAFTYQLMKPDSAIVYYKKVIAYVPVRTWVYNIIAVREIMERYSEIGNKDSCFVYLDSIKAFIDTMPETRPRRVSLSQNIATVYQWLGMFKTATSYYQVAVNGARKNGNAGGLGLALANLGELYDESEDDSTAILYAKEGLGLLLKDPRPYMQTAANIATYYTNLDQFDSALVYLQKSETVARQLNDDGQLNAIQLCLANIYIARKKYQPAQKLLEKSMVFLKENDDRWSLVKNYLALASLDSSLHNYISAKNNLLKALSMAKDNKQQVLAVIALQNLAIINARLGDYKSAYEMQREYLIQKDSMTSAKTKANLSDLEITYQTRQKEEQIALLKKDNDINKLQLQNSRRAVVFYVTAFLMALTVLGVVFYQRNLRHKLETQKIKAELQTQILRLQMNPHFIFNSLNSIENFIMQNEKRLASDYLNKFARLIRMILDSSRTEIVPIAKDMEALQLYVDLEQLRFNNKFTYKTYIDPALLGGDYRAPSLLIQPYVENAIIHGLAHSDENDLNLTVTAVLDNDKIKYVVQDNGIGRNKSGDYNRQNKPFHQSIGLQLTADRVALYNGGRSSDDAIKITDLYDEAKIPDGTKVEIIINAV